MEKLAASDAEDCARLDGRITRLFSLLNGTRESINALVNQMASLRDTSDLTVRIDSLSTDIDALRRSADPTFPPVVPIVPLVRPFNAMSLPVAPQPHPTSYVAGKPQGVGRGGARKRQGPDHAAIMKCPRNEVFNPTHTQHASSSAQPMGNPSAVIIGPTVLAHRPGNVFANVLSLLPDSNIYNVNHLSCAQEDANHDTASSLAGHWSHTNPLAGTAHNMSVRVAGPKSDVLNALFSQGN